MSEKYTPSPNQKTTLQDNPNVVSLGRHEVVFDTLPDGSKTSVQRLDGITLGKLDDAYRPGINIPQEISYMIGEQRHVMFSSREFPAGFQKIITAAEEKQIAVGDQSTEHSDTEEYPWLHAQFNPKGEVIGVETIAPDIIQGYTIENGRAMAANLPPVQNLQARWYEAAARVNRPAAASLDLAPVPRPMTTDEQVSATVEGIGGGLGSLTGLFERIKAGNAARAAELGIPVSKLSVEDLNDVLRKAKSNTL